MADGFLPPLAFMTVPIYDNNKKQAIVEYRKAKHIQRSKRTKYDRVDRGKMFLGQKPNVTARTVFRRITNHMRRRLSRELRKSHYLEE